MDKATQEALVNVKQEALEAKHKRDREAIDQIGTLDWKNVPPPVLSTLLSQIPFKGSGTDPDYYLAPWQAMIFALRCFELGLSPFSNEVWYNPKNNKVNVTLEGKMKLARKNGYNLGPPSFSKGKRPAPKSATLPFGVTEDISYTCKITVNGKETAEYTAWLSEWFVPASPVWKTKYEHMLQLRAFEKCISFASGTGSSELPDDNDINGNAGPGGGTRALPVIEVVQPEGTE